MRIVGKVFSLFDEKMVQGFRCPVLFLIPSRSHLAGFELVPLSGETRYITKFDRPTVQNNLIFEKQM